VDAKAQLDTIFSDENLRSESIDSLKLALRGKLGGYGVAITEIAAGNKLYRGVRWPQRPALVKDLAHPPDQYVQLGRLNREHQSMFYASLAGPGALLEIHATAGDRIALSEWVVAEPLWMHNLGFHQDALKNLGGDLAPIRPRLSGRLPGETKANESMRRTLSLCMIEDIRSDESYRYKRSIAIGETLFDRASEIPLKPGGPRFSDVSGIAYPSIRLRGAADNVAIFPRFVRSSLILSSVYYLLIEDANQAACSFTALTLAMATTTSGTKLDWVNLPQPLDQRRSHFRLEDGSFISRNGFGKVYDNK
jgi:hypothetical protein